MTTDKDRAEFEAWATSSGSYEDLRRRPDQPNRYSSLVADCAWEGWQAARSRSGAVPAEWRDLAFAVAGDDSQPAFRRDFARQLLAAAPEPQQATPPSPHHGGEPVAYQLRCNGGQWRECRRETFERGNCGVASHKCDVRALYAAPVSAPVAAENPSLSNLAIAVEACRKLADHYDNEEARQPGVTHGKLKSSVLRASAAELHLMRHDALPSAPADARDVDAATVRLVAVARAAKAYFDRFGWPDPDDVPELKALANVCACIDDSAMGATGGVS